MQDRAHRMHTTLSCRLRLPPKWLMLKHFWARARASTSQIVSMGLAQAGKTRPYNSQYLIRSTLAFP